MQSLERFIKELEESASPPAVATGAEVLSQYRRDGLREFRAYVAPEVVERVVVVYPEDTLQVSNVVKLANKLRVAVVPFGAGTGLMGGAMPLRDSVMVDMRRMNRCLHISRENRLVTAEAGITLEAVQAKLRTEGLMLGHDPWSLPRATLGGSISTNGMGYTAAGYGSIRRQVLGLEAVLPTGEVVETRPAEDSSVGPSLTQLLIGAEGTLGIITKATLRVHLLPERQSFLGYEFESFGEGFRAIQEMYQRRVIPTGLDFGEQPEGPSDPEAEYPSELFLMVEGLTEEVEAKVARITRISEANGGRRKDDSWALDFWQHRHDVIYLYEKVVRGEAKPWWGGEAVFDFVHFYIPSDRVLQFRKLSGQVLARHGVSLVEAGLWKQAELFSLAFLKPAESSLEETVRDVSGTVDELIQLCHGMGGSMEYCHGVGVKLAKHMVQEHGQAGLEALRRIKQALDPNNIMNPGKLY